MECIGEGFISTGCIDKGALVRCIGKERIGNGCIGKGALVRSALVRGSLVMAVLVRVHR